MATKTKALTLVYYMTNHATKDEASTYQVAMAAALIRKILDEQDPAMIPPTEETSQDRLQKLPLRAFNRMANDREVSGVQMACSLLQLPACYTPKTELVRINLYYLRRRLPSIFRGSYCDDGRDEEHVTLRQRGNSYVGVFDDYRYRGPVLQGLFLYEYVKVIQKRSATNRRMDDNDDQGPLPPEKCSVVDDTLRLACHLVRSRWFKDDSIVANDIVSLQQPTSNRSPPRFQEQVLRQ